MTRSLEEVRDWARAKIASGEEPPWAWFQYMKLIETLDAILGGQASITTMENLPQSAQHQDAHLRLVDSSYRPDTVQSHPDTVSIPMPM